MKKMALSFLLVFSLCVTGVFAHAVEVIPSSQSRNGLLPDGTNIYDEPEGYQELQPMALLGYKYVPGYDRLVGFTFDYTFAYIYGTSVRYIPGASPSYTLTVTRSIEKETSWNVSGSLSGEFNISMVKANLQAAGGYESKDKAIISVGETWNCEFTAPGTYNLAWYMRGHKYYAQCGAQIQSTGSDHGQFTYFTLGSVTFPTDEIHFDIT